jgi:anti-anti-sigma factor
MNGNLFVWVGDGTACVRVTGRANFITSADFKKLMQHLRDTGCRRVALDLSDCVLMDSTFLGVLAGFGLKMNSAPKDQCNHGIELLNPSPRVTELLESLGVLHLFRLAQSPLTLPDGTQTRAHTPANSSKEEVTRACLEAHRTLMEINPGNVAKFKEVAQFLAENLKKLRTT